MSLLLATYLATQAWVWDATPGATSYRLYYGSHPAKWCPLQYSEILASAACAGTNRCQHPLPEPTGNVIFFNVTAVNSAGESLWDHGVKVCP